MEYQFNEAEQAFSNLVKFCAMEPELVKQFNRLTGRNFGQSLTRTPIEMVVDEAVGYSGENDEDIEAFTMFVLEYVWIPLHGK